MAVNFSDGLDFQDEGTLIVNSEPTAYTNETAYM